MALQLFTEFNSLTVSGWTTEVFLSDFSDKFLKDPPFACNFLHQPLFCSVFHEHWLPSGSMCWRLFKNILFITFASSFSLLRFKQLHSMFKTCQVATLSSLAGRSSPCHTPESALGSDILKFLNNKTTFLRTPPGALIAIQTY